jgi:hypothetical protein
MTLLVGTAAARDEQRTARSRLAPAAAGSAVVLLGLGLSAYFWLPAVVEKGFLHADRLLPGPGAADRMSFTVGPVHLLVGIAGFVLALRSPDRKRRALALAFGAAAMAGVWLSTDSASFLLPGLFLPLLAVFAFERVGPRWTLAVVALLVVMNLPHTEAKGFLTFDDEYYDPQSIAARGLSTGTREEYEPRWVEERPPYEARRIVGVAAPLLVTEVSRRAAREELVVRAPAPTTAELTTFYYPGWTVTVDGVPAAVSPVPVRGTMRFDLPAGEHRVVLELAPTPVRRAAMLVTALTSLLLVGVASVGLFRAKRQWMQGFGKLRRLRKETKRIQARVDEVFEVTEPEDRT